MKYPQRALQKGSMGQSKLSSLYETLLNIAIGAVVSWFSQLLVFPMFDIHISLMDNFWILMWFTLISVVRGYIIRRWFNSKLQGMAIAMAGNKK